MKRILMYDSYSLYIKSRQLPHRQLTALEFHYCVVSGFASVNTSDFPAYLNIPVCSYTGISHCFKSTYLQS